VSSGYQQPQQQQQQQRSRKAQVGPGAFGVPGSAGINSGPLQDEQQQQPQQQQQHLYQYQPNQQQNSRQQQQQQEPIDCHAVRARCAQLLHKLSLFAAGDDGILQLGQQATAATNNSSSSLRHHASNKQTAGAAAAAGGPAGLAGGPQKRWAWLAAERRDAEGRTPGALLLPDHVIPAG
jgi:hypothetical protein